MSLLFQAITSHSICSFTNRLGFKEIFLNLEILYWKGEEHSTIIWYRVCNSRSPPLPTTPTFHLPTPPPPGESWVRPCRLNMKLVLPSGEKILIAMRRGTSRDMRRGFSLFLIKMYENWQGDFRHPILSLKVSLWNSWKLWNLRSFVRS